MLGEAFIAIQCRCHGTHFARSANVVANELSSPRAVDNLFGTIPLSVFANVGPEAKRRVLLFPRVE